MTTRARKTNPAAYTKLVVEKRLAHWHSLVYDHLYKHGPDTQKNTWEALISFQGTYSGVTSRFPELVRMGLIETCGRGTNHNGNVARLYDVTDRDEIIPDTRQEKAVEADVAPPSLIAWKARAISLETLCRQVAEELGHTGEAEQAARLHKRIDEILR